MSFTYVFAVTSYFTSGWFPFKVLKLHPFPFVANIFLIWKVLIVNTKELLGGDISYLLAMASYGKACQKNSPNIFEMWEGLNKSLI